MSLLDLTRRNNDIYRTLREKIVFVDYEPGHALSEAKVARNFNCSRVPVREAFILLDAEDLITIVPNQGTYVTEVNLEYLQKNFLIRKNLVPLLGRLAAANINEDQIEQIRVIVEEMKVENDYKKLLRLDYRLHRIMHKATKNPLLSKILDELLGHAVRSWIVTLDERISAELIPGNFIQLISELEARNRNACAEIMKEHAQSSLDSLRKLINDLEDF